MTYCFELQGKRVFVAGHRGMVGSAVVRRLSTEDCQLMTASREALDLRQSQLVDEWFEAKKPEVVVLAAARVGGIMANATNRADFIYDNLAIATNVIHAAYRHRVQKLLHLGSTCIYPRLAPQPMKEEHLLTGPLEPTNEPYAIAKIAGIKLCEAYRDQHGCDFISLMPTNLYGPGDNYENDRSHVAAALIRRIHEAKVAEARSTVIWGTGTPRREFLYVDDFADACVFTLKRYSDRSILNVGVGTDMSISNLATHIAATIGYKGTFEYDTTKPDGTPRKLVDTSRLSALGWSAHTPFEEGLRSAYVDFLRRTNISN